MTALTLTRSDPTKNLHRYYRLEVQPDLFGEWCFIREWGRIGKSGQVRVVPFPTPAVALAALKKQRHAKERKGYLSSEAEVVIFQSRLQRLALKYNDSSCHSPLQSGQSGLQNPAICQSRLQCVAGRGRKDRRSWPRLPR